MSIVLPTRNFTPYPYQRELWQKLVPASLNIDDVPKVVLVVAHRRWGKDRLLFNATTVLSQLHTGFYSYYLPTLDQARDVIFEGITDDGTRFLDDIPPKLIRGKITKNPMTIRMNNGSIIRIRGGFNIERSRGGNPTVAVLSEAQHLDPKLWETLQPIFTRSSHKGSIILIGTPFGTNNYFYELYEKAMSGNYPDWYVLFQNVEDTTDFDGNPIMSKEAIEQSGMSDHMIRQEYYCEFLNNVEGTIYGAYVDRMVEEGRFCDFELNPHAPIFVTSDLGATDDGVFLILQIVDNKIMVFDCFVKNREPLTFFIDWVRNFESKYQRKVYEWIFPWDLTQRDKSANVSIGEQILRENGIRPCVSRQFSRAGQIELVRRDFHKLWIHKTNCSDLFKALSHFHKEWNDHTKVFSDKPCHDWSSHPCDALATYFTYKTGGGGLRLIDY